MLNKRFSKTVAVVQARMNSTRLPGKVLREFSNGMTLLEVLLIRLKESKTIEEIVVAYPWQPAENDAITKVAVKHDCFTFRGEDADVLDRFYKAAVSRKAGIVARVCADNPLTDPRVLDRCIENFRELGVDYLIPEGLPTGTFPEIMSIDALDTAWNEATDPADREHVTTYIRADTKKFKQYTLQWEPAQWVFPRVTVDTETDFKLVDTMISRFNDVAQLTVDHLKR